MSTTFDKPSLYNHYEHRVILFESYIKLKINRLKNMENRKKKERETNWNFYVSTRKPWKHLFVRSFVVIFKDLKMFCINRKKIWNEKRRAENKGKNVSIQRKMDVFSAFWLQIYQIFVIFFVKIKNEVFAKVFSS